MAKNTLEKIYLALVNNGPRIEIDEELRVQALAPLEKMLSWSASVPMSNSPGR